ncbi:MAG TPA: molybdenum cofactor guanylyltransferase [Anaeromyxobacteraceae bacterium]|nr:molybdenum cofactor guanylyltransferase [Anaeromyxobacteraceae bacterium]
MERIPDCTGVLLAGGRASRLGGVAKGLVRTGSSSIAARSLALFRETFDEVLLVANDPAPYLHLGAPVIADVIPGKGAPGGLHAALSAVGTAWVFVAACDMPFLDAQAIRFLWERRAALAVAVEWERGFEGLHAFWSRLCLPTVERMLQEGDPSLRAIAQAVGARVLTADEWRAVDPAGRSFENANTPADLARLGLDVPRR